jgi:hypothetical protein
MCSTSVFAKMFTFTQQRGAGNRYFSAAPFTNLSGLYQYPPRAEGFIGTIMA